MIICEENVLSKLQVNYWPDCTNQGLYNLVVLLDLKYSCPRIFNA